MHKLKTGMLALLCMAAGWRVYGQDYGTEVAAMEQALKAQQSVKVEVKGRIQFLPGLGMPDQPLQAVMLRTPERAYSSWLGFQTYEDAQISIAVDEEGKFITLADGYGKKGGKLSNLAQMMDMPVGVCNVCRVNIIGDGTPDMPGTSVVQVEVPVNDDVIQKKIVSISQKTHLPFRFVYYYDNTVEKEILRVEQDYTFTPLGAGFQDSRLQLSYFLKASGSQPQAADRFRGYQILDQRTQVSQ